MKIIFPIFVYCLTKYIKLWRIKFNYEETPKKIGWKKTLFWKRVKWFSKVLFQSGGGVPIYAAFKVGDGVSSYEELPYINTGGVVTNNPDNEDLTAVEKELKFADKSYTPAAFSGMGRRYLRKNILNTKNILVQSMMSFTNTRYIIQYDYDLNGQTITVPEGCILQFEGGSLNNGTLQLLLQIILLFRIR